MPDGILYICPECGTGHNQWMGFCYACGSGEPLVEAAPQRSTFSVPRGGRQAARPPVAGHGPTELVNVSLDGDPRIVLPFPELNRVLGGGLVPGSVALLAGDPGIGKSTLLLQVAGALAPGVELADNRGGVLYVAGEESASQVRMRAQRLGVSGRNLLLLNETAAPDVLGWMERVQPCAVLVDSIQTLHSEASNAAPGSVGQIRECARLLIAWAKTTRTPVIIAGHVTKEGDIAGPRVLEHMVDVVLYLEGESMSALRLLRSEKNRFGSTNEVALFQMDAAGLVEVADPSRQLLAHRNGPLVGSVLAPVLQGTRPMLVEVQALTAPVVGPAPRRVANGLDTNRLVMLATVLSRRSGVPLGSQDVVVNVTGGLRVNETAADLALALAMASSFRDQPLDANVAALGEVGLGGEVRPVAQMGRRLQEAARLGLKRVIAPASAETDPAEAGGLEVVRVTTVSQAIRSLFPRRSGPGAPEAESLNVETPA
ncbi:MAG: DNA repair protein RadA [Chloroflexota bacterium]|nr:DNA repair protein RadA [Chloroflexota bacterium]